MSNQLQTAFSPESFRSAAHSLVDALADYLESAQNQSIDQVIPFQNPDETIDFWQKDYENNDRDISKFFENTIQQSIHLHHPRYMGHQVTPPLPITAVASLLSGLLNNGMAVYEMGLVSNPLERILSEILAKKIGYGQEASGLLTSGGSLANLTALLTARASKSNVWEEGSSEKLAVMVSEESHYCVDRAARIMGLGSEGIIKIRTNEQFQIRTELLEGSLQEAENKGLNVFCIVGSACSTSTGSYDNLIEIGHFAKKHNLWFHVDGAHGAAVVFSEKYKHLVHGISEADSVVIDWHKMLMTPALATSIIYKNGEESYKTFQQKAQYLWANQNSHDWFNSGKRTFECTKLMISVKIYSIIKAYGIGIFEENVDFLYDLGRKFAEMVLVNPNFELAINPQSNIVCFRFVKESITNLDELNSLIRSQLVQEGKFYIVQTMINGSLFLRVTLLNPMTQISDLEALLEEINRIGNQI
ncbi:MAG: aminotransferase class I/II-fold pyridoxal phosphate-dependent enzyme [Bacteroidota bacterium]